MGVWAIHRSQAGGGAHCSCPERMRVLWPTCERRVAAGRMTASLPQGWRINRRIRELLRHSDAYLNDDKFRIVILQILNLIRSCTGFYHWSGFITFYHAIPTDRVVSYCCGPYIRLQGQRFKTCGKLWFETMNHRDAMFAKYHITHLQQTLLNID